MASNLDLSGGMEVTDERNETSNCDLAGGIREVTDECIETSNCDLAGGMEVTDERSETSFLDLSPSSVLGGKEITDERSETSNLDLSPRAGVVSPDVSAVPEVEHSAEADLCCTCRPHTGGSEAAVFECADCCMGELLLELRGVAYELATLHSKRKKVMRSYVRAAVIKLRPRLVGLNCEAEHRACLAEIELAIGL